jgi:hypothetical protein
VDCISAAPPDEPAGYRAVAGPDGYWAEAFTGSFSCEASGSSCDGIPSSPDREPKLPPAAPGQKIVARPDPNVVHQDVHHVAVGADVPAAQGGRGVEIGPGRTGQ